MGMKVSSFALKYYELTEYRIYYIERPLIL